MKYPVAFALIAGMLCGCATVQPITPPATAAMPAKAYVNPRLPTLYEKLGAATDIPNTYFGVSGASGSLMVGLLGPLGVLANTSYVQSTNEKITPMFAGFLPLNLADLLREADGTLSVSSAPRIGEFSIVPASRISVMEEKKFVVSCVLNVEYNQGTDKPWSARYQINSDVAFEIGDAGNAAAVTSLLRGCLVKAKELFVAHISGSLGTPTTKAIKFSDITLTMPVYTAKLPERIIGNDGFTVHDFPRSTVLKLE